MRNSSSVIGKVKVEKCSPYLSEEVGGAVIKECEKFFVVISQLN